MPIESPARVAERQPEKQMMSWEAFIAVPALVGLAFALITLRRKALLVLPLGAVLLWLVPYLGYWLAADSGNTAEFEAWSVLFIVPAWLSGCLVLLTVRLGMFLKGRGR